MQGTSSPTPAGHTPTPPPFQDKEKSLSEQRRYSLIDPASAPELLRLQHQLVSTEDALRDALDHAQQVERLVEALRGCSDRTQVSTQGCSLGNPSPKREAAPSWGPQSKGVFGSKPGWPHQGKLLRLVVTCGTASWPPTQ